MTPEELLEEWTDGKSGLRPARVQELRQEIYDYTGLTPPRRITEIESWVQRMKGHVTSALKDAVDDE